MIHKRSGDEKLYEQIGDAAMATGCWLNVVYRNDFMVAQTWLKNVEQAHHVAAPMTLMFSVLLITLGWEELPKAVSVFGAPPGEMLREPVPGVLRYVDGGWLLLDTGFNTALIRGAALHRRFHGREVYRAVLPGPGEPIEEALDEVGIDIRDVHAVALSHLHLDHAGGLRLFAGRVPVHAQRRELEYGLSSHPVRKRMRSTASISTTARTIGAAPTGTSRSLPAPPRC